MKAATAVSDTSIAGSVTTAISCFSISTCQPYSHNIEENLANRDSECVKRRQQLDQFERKLARVSRCLNRRYGI